MKLAQILNAIQTNLKAPKGQINKFGGYAYRSCEDILEAEGYKVLSAENGKKGVELAKSEKPEIIVSDITFEAMIDVHANNTKGLCMYRDELRGVFNDLNKYRKGSDLEFLLSNWNSHPIKSFANQILPSRLLAS